MRIYYYVVFISVFSCVICENQQQTFPRFQDFPIGADDRWDPGFPANQPYAYANPFSLFSVNPQKTYLRYTKPYYKKPISGKQYFIPSNQPKQPRRFPKYPPPQILGKLPKPHSAKYSYHPYVAHHHVLDSYDNDPVYHKVRQDVKDNGKRLKLKEIQDGRPHSSDKDVDGVKRDPDSDAEEKFKQNEEHENFPIEHEHHDTQKLPDYYSAQRNPPIRFDRVNQKLKLAAPNGVNAKISPKGYQPIKNYINNLKSTQAQAFGAGVNDYPSLNAYVEHGENTPEGYDIYEKQNNKFDATSAGFNENFNKFNNKYHKNKSLPPSRYHDSDDEVYKSAGEEEFVPIKMYAQVRHTETTKHLPKEAAYEDAVTYDDVVNAPRLREAVKSSKFQTVYSEEGYEDNAYDHAGHLKHASNQEEHGGYVKDKDAAGGHYADGDEDKEEYRGGKNSYGKNLDHGKKWYSEDKKNEDFDNHKTYRQKEGEFETNINDLDDAGSEKKMRKSFVPKNKLIMTEDTKKTMIKNTNDGQVIVNTKTKHVSMDNENKNDKKPKYVRLRPNYYWKRPKKTNSTKAPEKVENHSNNSTISPTNKLKGKFVSKRVKRSEDFQVPILDFRETYLTDDDILELKKEKLRPPLPKLKRLNNRIKYPYYEKFAKYDFLRNSPIRYAQNLRHVPIKTPGGSEFYNSRSKVHCSEVEPEVDPVPDRIKNITPEDEKEESDEETREKRSVKLSRQKRQDFDDQHKEQSRLKGLGDHIDCFKEKYFDENPLDNPFFFEDEIAPPEPIKTPFQTPASQIKSSRLNYPTESKPILRTKKHYKTQATTFKPIYVPKPKAKLAPKPKPKPNLLTGEVYIDRHNDNNLETSDVQKSKIVLPNAVFDKYIYSRDPQMRLYGDVLGNIRANLKAETGNKSPLLTTYRPSFIPIHNQNQNGNRPIVYEVYTNKENVLHPNKQHIRIARNSDFEQRGGNYSNHKNSPSEFEPKKRKPVDHKTLKLESEANSSLNKTYKTIDRTQRQSVESITASSSNINEDSLMPGITVDSRRGEPRYEGTDDENIYKNHKKYYSPVTVKESISPEELKVEYLLKRQEDDAYEQPATEKVLLDSYGQLVDMKKIDPDGNLRHRFQASGIRDNPTVFDVTAYLPKPLYFPVYPRHNISSRYNDGVEKSTESAIQIVNLPIPTITNNFEVSSTFAPTTKISDLIITNTAERVLNATPEIKIGAKRQRIPSSTTTTTTTQKPTVRKRKRIRLTTTTTTTTTSRPSLEDYDDYEIPTTKRTFKSRVSSTRKAPPKKTTTSRPEDSEDYDHEEHITETRTQPPATEPPQRTTTLRNIRSRRPVSHYGKKDNPETIKPNKPRIVEKTSTKRKKTVITNSKRYDNLDNTPEKSKKDDKEKLVVKESGHTIPNKRHDEDISNYQEGSRESSEYEKPSINEETRFEEDVEEEEVIKDSRFRDFRRFQDPNLAKDINRLSEPIKEDQYPIHSDVEIFQANFAMNRGPKHGGNYRVAPKLERLRKRLDQSSELEDLNANSDDSLHGGNYRAIREDQIRDKGISARVLNSFAALLPIASTTEKPVNYEKDPGQRLYYFVKV